MPRTYLSAASRCRQLERLVRTHCELTSGPTTVSDLVRLSGLSYQSVCAYVTRLARERRVEVVLVDPVMGAKSLQHLYAPGRVPLRKVA